MPLHIRQWNGKVHQLCLDLGVLDVVNVGAGVVIVVVGLC